MFCDKYSNKASYNSLTFKSAMLGFSFFASGFELTNNKIICSKRSLANSQSQGDLLANWTILFLLFNLSIDQPTPCGWHVTHQEILWNQGNQRIFPVQTWVTNSIYIANCFRKYLNLNTQLINYFILNYYADLWSQIFIDFPRLHT